MKLGKWASKLAKHSHFLLPVRSGSGREAVQGNKLREKRDLFILVLKDDKFIRAWKHICSPQPKFGVFVFVRCVYSYLFLCVCQLVFVLSYAYTVSVSNHCSRVTSLRPQDWQQNLPPTHYTQCLTMMDVSTCISPRNTNTLYTGAQRIVTHCSLLFPFLPFSVLFSLYVLYKCTPPSLFLSLLICTHPSLFLSPFCLPHFLSQWSFASACIYPVSLRLLVHLPDLEKDMLYFPASLNVKPQFPPPLLNMAMGPWSSTLWQQLIGLLTIAEPRG